MVRSEHDGSGASGAIEPLAEVGRLLPSGVTNVAGGGPSHGASTRTSMPIWRSSRARPSTWACTPPGIDRLYGQTMADPQEPADRSRLVSPDSRFGHGLERYPTASSPGSLTTTCTRR